MPAPNRSPTTFMPSISGPSMTSSGRAAARRASSVSASMNSVMPCTRAWVEPLGDRSRRARPGRRRARPPCRPCTWGPARPGARWPPALAVEDDVLDRLAQLRLDLVIDRQVAGVDDAHVHARGDGVVEEHRVHRPAHRLVAAEAERDVGDAAGDPRVRQQLLDRARRLDEVDGVVVVLLDPGGDGEDVGIEDDVFGRKADLLGQQAYRRARRSRPCGCGCRPGPARRRP